MGFFTQNDSATNVFPLLLFPGQIQMELILENEFEGQFQSPHFRFIEKLTTTYAFLYNRQINTYLIACFMNILLILSLTLQSLLPNKPTENRCNSAVIMPLDYHNIVLCTVFTVLKSQVYNAGSCFLVYILKHVFKKQEKKSI